MRGKYIYLAVILIFTLMIISISSASCKDADNSKGNDNLEEMSISAYLAGGCEPAQSKENLTSKFVMDKFKISLDDVTWPAGEDVVNKINMMVASGEMPDVVQYWSDPEVFNRLADAGMLLELDDLISEHMPNYLEYVSDDILSLFRNPKDGKLYILPSFTILPENQERFVTINNVLVVIDEILEKTGLEAPDTPEDLYQLLTAIKNLNQEDLIPFGEFEALDRLSVMFGMPPYKVTIDHDQGQIIEKWLLPQYEEYLQWIAKCYREGLIEPEVFTINNEIFHEKARAGRYAVSIVAPDWAISWYNPAFQQRGMDYNYIPLRMPRKEGVEKTYYWTYSPFGWSISCISKNVSDPERLLEFIDWKYTREGNMVMGWGAPSKEENIWYVEDGKEYFNQEIFDKYQSGEMSLNSGEWAYWFNLPGYSADVDPTIAGCIGSPGESRFWDDVMELNKDAIYSDVSYEKYLLHPKGDVYKEKMTNIITLADSFHAQIVMNSSSEEDVSRLYQEMKDELIKAGLIEVQKENYDIYKSVNP